MGSPRALVNSAPSAPSQPYPAFLTNVGASGRLIGKV
jgi:hypothetical protein